jgi:hypothetical protein
VGYNGVISYNPNYILSRAGGLEWFVIRSSVRGALDVNNDGIVDPTETPVNQGMYMIVHRSTIEK